ncbi:MAG: large conductance mechanosensitive channel protein MscL [Oscillospiraceae bacterium]|nr:large conductance mechanosensitive channel protein MscL [Oscillospiraceae bacterium]
MRKFIKKFFSEFTEFALRGNVMNLAVGVIIGVAFQGVVTSLTDNILSPIIGLFIRRNLDFLTVTIWNATLYYGAFLTTVMNFFIMAFVVFLIVRGMNRVCCIGKKPEDEPATERTCPFCMSGVHKEATRCHSCTSILDNADTP